MDKIYKNYSDVPVAAYVIYAKNTKACADAGGTKQLKTGELKEMFLKGAVVDTGNGSFSGYSLNSSKNIDFGDPRYR